MSQSRGGLWRRPLTQAVSPHHHLVQCVLVEIKLVYTDLSMPCLLLLRLCFSRHCFGQNGEYIYWLLYYDAHQYLCFLPEIFNHIVTKMRRLSIVIGSLCWAVFLSQFLVILRKERRLQKKFFFQGVFERKFPFMIGRQMYFWSLLTTLPPPTPPTPAPPPSFHCKKKGNFWDPYHYW